MTPAEIEQFVAAELERISDRGRRAALEHVLVPPTSQERTCSYTGRSFRCWVVARNAASGCELVYCRGTFGDPWGCLEAGGPDLGTDAQWFTKLEDAFLVGMWDGPLPPDYEVE